MAMQLDRTDFVLLRALQKDARLSNKELASAAGIAASTCHERLRRLREGGVLLGHHAEVAPAALGIGLHALISVRIRRHARPLVDQFRQHLESLEQVVELYHLAGAVDYLLHVAVADVDALRRLVMDAFTSRDEIEHMETSLVFEHRRRPVLPNYLADRSATPSAPSP